MALQSRLSSLTNKTAEKLNKLHGWTTNELTETNNLIIDVANMIPTDNVELDNGAGYITGISNITQIPSRSYNDLQDKPDLDGLYVNASGDTMDGPLIISKTDSPGSVLFDIQGSNGQLFSITDSLEGDLFSVNDISGLPILNVHSEDGVEIDGTTLAESFVVSGGTSNDFLKGDGTLDSNTYSLSTHTHSFNDLTDVPDLDDKRTIKVIPNTSQYTFIEEDFYEKFVVFTGNTTVTVYVSDTLSPLDGEIRGIALGTTILKFLGSGAANLTSTDGTFKETSGEGSVFGIRATSTNNFYAYGDLKPTEEYSLSNHNHDTTYVKKWETWVSNFNITGDILPTQNNTYDIGSPTNAFTNMYVGIGAFYVNGKKVIEDIANVMNITTAIDQDIDVSTSGSGNLILASKGTGNVEINATSGNIQLNGTTLFQAGKLIKSSNGSNLLFDDSIQFSTGEGISGDLPVSGYVTATGFKIGVETGFVKANGTVDNTVYVNTNDSRVANGQTAFNWGDHSLAGYSTTGHTHSQYENNLTFSATGAATVSRTGDTITIGATNTTYSGLDLTTLNTGTETTNKLVSAKTLTDWANVKYASSGHNHSGVYEPVFTKNGAFNKNFGSAAGTVAQGNDSRINNGQTAFGWGDHSLAGYSTTGHTHDYRWNLKTNGVQRTTVGDGGNLDLVAGAHTSISYGAGGVVTITGANDNTTYSAGSGIDLIGTIFSHGNTTTQNSVDNANGTVIQDITLDSFGHITAIGSKNLDDRYYTESEIDTQANDYYRKTGGVLTGNLQFNSTNQGVVWNMNTDGAWIKFHNTGDADPDSHLEFHVSDNGNEYFKWTIKNGATTYDAMTLKGTAGNLWVAGSVDAPVLKFNGQSTDDRYALAGHDHSGVYEPVISKNEAFNKNFGTAAGTVAQGNDSRINNGQTAYGWGNHADAGYLTVETDSQTLTWTSGNGNLSISNGNTVNLDDRYIIEVTPSAPSTVSSTVVNGNVEISFNQSITSGVDSYAVYSSVAGGEYGLISVVPPEDFDITMVVVDASFNISGTMAYRIYAVKNGVYSTPATTSVVFSAPAIDPSNMSVTALNNVFQIGWDPHESRFVDSYNVYKHAHDVEASLDRALAVLVYSGDRTTYMYDILQSEENMYHQFWVEITTK
jgi:hypothetical protein